MASKRGSGSFSAQSREPSVRLPCRSKGGRGAPESIASGIVAARAVHRAGAELRERVVAMARLRETGATHPNCARPARRVRHFCVRSLSEILAHGRRVRVDPTVRRFRCGNDRRPRRTFAERFRDDIVAPCARRRARLQCVIRQPGLALGGRPGRGLARRPLTPVSEGAQARVVRARAPEAKPASREIGVDARASLRRHRPRIGATRDRRAASRPVGGHGRGVVERSS